MTILTGSDRVTLRGVNCKFDELVPHMNARLLARLHVYIRWSTCQAFVDTYAEIHRRVFEREWTLDGKRGSSEQEKANRIA